MFRKFIYSDMNHVKTFELFTEGLRNFSFLLDDKERKSYFIEEIDADNLKKLYKFPKYFDDKEKKHILLYTKGEILISDRKTSFKYRPLKNINFEIEKYSIRDNAEDHSVYILKVNKDGVETMYYAGDLVSCFKKMDELIKSTKKVFKDWL